ncbi:MAG: nucleotidyl transferase AbiEii/AbiGii toxin family protein [Mycoplasmataceae bacterium]|nr:nucleotidyl transferase AbiEii/AbiGii toxin family protein [Mycoplasmataceae bacterium]
MFVLKGGTALCKFYNDPRFSEDIDLDSPKGNIGNIVKRFCKQYGYHSPCKKKDTLHGQKFMINYGVPGQLLKVETSHRDKMIPKFKYIIINGIRVYKLEQIAITKLNAFITRDKIRDLYDITFIINHKWHLLSEETKKIIKDNLLTKNLLNQNDLVIHQEDNLIDKDELETNILSAYEKLESS